MKKVYYEIDLRLDPKVNKGMYVFTMMDTEDYRKGKNPDNFYWNDSDFAEACGPFLTLQDCLRSWTRARAALKSTSSQQSITPGPLPNVIPYARNAPGQVIHVDFAKKMRI